MKKTEKEPFDPNKKAEQTKAAGDPAGDAKQNPKKEPEQEDSQPEQEDTQPGQDAPEAQSGGPSQEEEQPEKVQPEKEEPAQEEEPAPAEPSSTAAENEKLKADLLEARSQIAAYSAGVAPEMVADAVTLATAEAKAAGEVTEEAVAKAMDNVLKRHPEWKTKPSAGGAKKTTGGFKLGADPDSTGRDKGTFSEKGGSKKPWNKFNR